MSLLSLHDAATSRHWTSSCKAVSSFRVFNIGNALWVWGMKNTFPKTNIAPEHGPCQKGISSSNHRFSGAMLVSGRVTCAVQVKPIPTNSLWNTAWTPTFLSPLSANFSAKSTLLLAKHWGCACAGYMRSFEQGIKNLWSHCYCRYCLV